jgi:hypothetical protein
MSDLETGLTQRASVRFCHDFGHRHIAPPGGRAQSIFKCYTARVTVFPWPCWWKLIAGKHFTLKRFGSIRGRHAPSHRSMFGGESVLDAVQEEFFEGGDIGLS